MHTSTPHPPATPVTTSAGLRPSRCEPVLMAPGIPAWLPLLLAAWALPVAPAWSAEHGAAAHAAPVRAGAVQDAHAAPAKGGAVAPAAHSAHAAPAPHGAAGKSTEKPHTAAPAQQVAVAPMQAPSSDADAMERLRLRLGERLTTAKPAANAQGPLEVQVLSKAPPPPAAAGHGAKAHGAKAGAHGTAHGKTHGKGHDAHAAHWSYAGPAGPQSWGGLKPDFQLCSKGQRQSPIDIQGGLPVELEPVQFNYKASRFAVVDNGHTVQANLQGGNFIEVGGRRFELKQFHFHRPSEERIDGRQFEMSVHLVHKDEQGRLAVVALLLDRGAPHAAVQKVWNSLPLEQQQELPGRTPLELTELLPADHSYYTYMGSLTTPPCSEGVQWIVMRQPVSVSAAQIELFARLYPMNARPIQQVAGRRILQTP